MSDPRPSPSPTNGNGRLGVVERLAAILRSLTLQNVLVMGILVAISIPSYFVWQLLHDTELRKEILSYAKETDMGVPCQVVFFSFSGQHERTAVFSGVRTIGNWEVLVGTRVYGMMTQKEAMEACKLMIETAEKVRSVFDAKEKQ